MHQALINAMYAQPAFREVVHQLPLPADTLSVGGLPGSAGALLVAALAARFEQRLWVVVARTPADAEAFEADLHALLGERRVVLFPQRETLPYEAAEHHVEVSGLRVEAIEAVFAGRARVLVTTARALQERAEIPSALAELRLTLRTGQLLRPRDLEARLESMGFERTPIVEAVGQFALRGGILDLFGFGAPEPLRVEFWGDEIASIRNFDVLDQRSTKELRGADVLPVDLRRVSPEPAGPAPSDDALATESRNSGSEGVSPSQPPASARRSLLDVLSRDAVLVLLSAGSLRSELDRTWNEVVHLHDAEVRRGGTPDEPASLFLEPAPALEHIAAFGRIEIDAGVPAPTGHVAAPTPTSVAKAPSVDSPPLHTPAPSPASVAKAPSVRFDAREVEEIDRDIERLSALLRAGAARGEDTYILCDNTGQLERLEELLGAGTGLPPRTSLALGAVSAGFVLEGAEPPVRVLTDHEIFRRARRLRRTRRFRGAVALENLAQLRAGDFVVHLDHGIGRFNGLERVVVAGEEVESLAIEYANGETLRVPVYRLDLIERWVPDREDAPPPKLHRIGGRAWKTLRRKTEHAIQEMAAQLLQLYAARQLSERPPYSPDSRWQKEMESSFLYEDTPDQRQATADVKRDLEARTPMDRLLCGDVGYGKTEIAIRAAFKAIQDGRQVAVLAPTTILVEQHLHTFRQRLAGYPVRIEALSRFRSAREQREILAAIAGGQVDIVIGTHRLIEPDVVFKELGLLVIDEEQRFGVKQKERFKEMKTTVDVLSLTATPIPRTLHLSLAGLRDLTLLQTPPRDRMPIITHVLPWVEEVLEDAIHRELDRGGQVFVVHNRVQSIAGVTERVRRLAPSARIAVAHGQMPPAELEGVMRRFLEGEVDVLVTTAIIENGLDVPTANTLIVDRADYFGLAQLYQLRGRVGRSHHRAYCYLIVPEGVAEDAERRLRILEHYTDLGSGYAIALKDLELRGAGNILGAEQSGAVHAVGLDTYTRMLENAIRRLRSGEDAAPPSPADVALEGAAYFPDAYVSEAAQKLHLYRRLSKIEAPAHVIALLAEVRDRYGPPPPETLRLFLAAQLRLLGSALGIESILVRNDAARVTFSNRASPRLASLQTAFHDQQVEVEVRRTLPLSLVLHRRGAHPIADTLSAALERLAEDRARAA